MNNTFSIEQLSKTGYLDTGLILRPFKMDLKARFMEIKSANPKIRQDQIAKESGCSISTLQRDRQGINMLSCYRIPSTSLKERKNISKKTLDDDSHHEHDLKRPKMPSIELIRPKKIERNKHVKKSKLKRGGNIEKKDEYLDEILHITNL